MPSASRAKTPAGSRLQKKPMKAPAKKRPPKKAPTKGKKSKKQKGDATSQPAENKTTKYVHTTGEQFLAMLQRLEIPANYKIIVGESTAGKTVAHGTGITMVEGFKRMAAQANDSTIHAAEAQGLPTPSADDLWTGKVCQSPWKSYFSRYKTTRDKLMIQTSFGITDEMRAVGYTLEEAVKKPARITTVLDKVCGKQSNVKPSSHTTEPEREESDAYRSDGPDASLPGNEEVFGSADNSSILQGAMSDADSLEFTTTYGFSDDATSQALTNMSTTTSETSVTAPLPLSATPPAPPSYASRNFPDAASGDARGVEKSNIAKRRDFASIYTEASERRLEFSEKRMPQEFVLKEKKLEQEGLFRRQELEERKRDRLQRAADKRAEEKNKMALRLLLSGKQLAEVNEILKVFFSD